MYIMYSTIQSVSPSITITWFLPLIVIQYSVMYNVAMVMYQTHICYVYFRYIGRLHYSLSVIMP